MYTGLFTYSDDSLSNSGTEELTVDTLEFPFLGVTYTESNGLSAPAEALFFDGEFLGLALTAPDFSLLPGFFDLSEAFFAYEVAAGSGLGGVTYTQSQNSQSVPEPVSGLALLAAIAAGGSVARQQIA